MINKIKDEGVDGYVKFVMTENDIMSSLKGYIFEKFVGLLSAYGKEFKAKRR